MKRVDGKVALVIGLLATLLVAGALSFYASSSPDGLSYVAETQGFAESEEEHALGDSPFSDYETAPIADDGDARLSKAVAGVAGVGVTLLVAGGLALMLRRRGAADARTDADSRTDAGVGTSSG